MDTENEYGNLEKQQYLLPILVDIDTFCRDHSIKYSLSDGTLLGAIRHKGFIPWDDDIDITFDRENFNKFINAAAIDLPNEYEIIHDIWIRRISRKDNPGKNMFPPEGCIDLFIFDNVPDNKKKEKLQVFCLKLLQGMIKTNVIYEGFSTRKKALLFITHEFGKIFPPETKKKWYDLVSQWENSKHTGKIARYNGSYKGIGKARYPSSIVDSYVEVSFEEKQFMAFRGWDKFLTNMYGDYMKVPEKQYRNSRHDHVGAKT